MFMIINFKAESIFSVIKFIKSYYNTPELMLRLEDENNGGSFFSQWGIIINKESEFYNLSDQPGKIQIEPNSTIILETDGV